MGAVSVMDWQARAKKTPAAQREELYDLYVRRHDLIDTWDLVDRAAPHVVGGYLVDKPRDQLYVFAASEAPMERRTAIVATWFFIRTGDLDDTFAIAEILAHDPDELVQKAVGGWVREAGKRDEARLRAYLDRVRGHDAPHRAALRRREAPARPPYALPGAPRREVRLPPLGGFVSD